MRRLCWACMLLCSTVAMAQDEQPAVDPAASAPPPKAGSGTTIVGERESPIGLYITPWRNSAPEAELDRPARLLDEAMLPVDPDVFSRYVEYYNALAEHRAQKQGAANAPK